MAINNKRQDMLQDFFETLATLNRLLGDTRSPFQTFKGERRRKERRQPQTELLYLLSREKEMTIKSIAAAMYITSSAATQMVENLVGQNLVERADDPNDRRVVKVKLTTRGKNQFQIIKKNHLGKLDQILKNLTSDELKNIVQVKKKLLGKPSKN